MRLDGWEAAYEAELMRLYGRIAARERVSIDELMDLREEGDVRRWSVDPEKRRRLNKTEAQIREELGKRREFLAYASKSRRDQEDERRESRRQQVDGQAEKRAASKLVIARALEGQGKREAALENYRALAEQFPRGLGRVDNQIRRTMIEANCQNAR